MADISGGVDFQLTVGANVELSYAQMQKDIREVVKRLNATPPKINVAINIDEKALMRVREQVAQLSNLTSSPGTVHSVGAVDVTGIRKAASAWRALDKAMKQAAETSKKTQSVVDRTNATPSKSSNNAKNINYESREYYTSLKQVNDLLTQVTHNQERWTAAKTGKSKSAYNDLGLYVSQLKSLQTQLETGTITASDFKKKLASIKAGVSSSTKVIKNAGEATKSWGDKVAALSTKFGTWLSITQVIMAGVRAVKAMSKSVIEVNSAMTELRKVTDTTEAAYDKFLTNATIRARKLGSTLSDTVRASADFARLGYNIEQSELLSDAAIIYKNVGDIADISQASQSIISTMQSFNIVPEEAMSIVDKFNEVGNKYAISSEGIGEALLRSAAAMKSAGNTLDETIALATAANTVVQNPETVGTTLKTVSMFLRASKTEAEEAGEATDGMANSVSELRSEILALTGNMVDIQADDNTFKSTYQILKEISEVWDKLTDVSKSNVLELVGGKRNANVVAALLENFSVAENALKTSGGSAGSALSENEKVLASLQGKINILKATFEDFSQSVISDEFLGGAIDGFTQLLSVLTAITEIFKPLPTTIGTVTLALTAFGKNFGFFKSTEKQLYLGSKNLSQMPESFKYFKSEGQTSFRAGVSSIFSSKDADIRANSFNALRNFSNDIDSGIPKIQAYKQHISGLDKEFRQAAVQIASGEKSIGDFGDATKDAGGESKAAAVSVTLLNAAMNMLIAAGISFAIKKLQELMNAQENAIQKADDFINKFTEQRDALISNQKGIEAISSEYEELADGVDSLGRNISLNSDEYARYNEIVNQIADMFPQMVQGYTDEGNAIIAHKGNVEKLTKAYQDQKKAAQDAIITGSAAVFKGFKAKVDYNAENFTWEESGLFQMKEMAQKLIATQGDKSAIKDVLKEYQNTYTARDLLKKSGLDPGFLYQNVTSEGYFAEHMDAIESAFNIINSEINAQAAQIKPIMQAYLENSEKFKPADDKVQDMVKQIVGQFDAEFYKQFDTETQMVAWVETNVIDKLSGNEDLVNGFSIMLDLQTKFNDGDVPVADYQEKLTAFLALTDNLPKDTQKAIKVLFGIETYSNGTEHSDIDTMVQNLKDEFKGKFDNEIGQLDSKDLKILYGLDVLPNSIKSWSEIETLIANARGEIDKVKISLDQMKTSSDAISSLSLAAKEMADNGYISTETLDKIREAAKMTAEEWTDYQTKLLSIKQGSAEFNQLMTELTYTILENTHGREWLATATQEEITAILRENGVIKAQEISLYASKKAREAERIEKELNKDASDENINKLIEEGSTCGLTMAAYYELLAAEIAFSDNDISVETKINQINRLREAIGLAKIDYSSLNEEFSGIWGKDRKDLASQYGIETKVSGFTTNANGERVENWLYVFAGKEYEELSDAIALARATDFGDKSSDERTPVTYDVSSDSKKNKALDDYLKKSEAALKTHKDELKYIDELQYAYDNLAKTEEERADILEKMAKAREDYVKRESEALDNIQSAYSAVQKAMEEKNEFGDISVDTLQSLLELEPQYINMLIDENGNLALNEQSIQNCTAAYIDNLAAKSALNLIDSVSHLKTEQEQLELLTGKAQETGSALWDVVTAQLAVVSSSVSPEVGAALTKQVEAIRKMAESAKSGLSKGGLNGFESEKAKNDLAEKEKKFAEDMANAWKEEHLEQLKDGLAKQEDILNQYKKNLEVFDFGLDYVAVDDFENRSNLLTAKVSQLTTYGTEMRKEFERVAAIIPQTGDEAQELANRLETLGSDMRSNISALRETKMAIEQLRIEAFTSIAEDGLGELEKELDNIDRRLEILRADNKDDFKYTNKFLNMRGLLPVYSDFDKERNEKQKHDSAMIKLEQTTQDKINAVVTKALEMQAKENAEARAKERQKLIEDMAKARQEVQKSIKNVQGDINKGIKETGAAIDKSIKDTEKKFKEAKIELPEVDATALIKSIDDVIDGIEKRDININVGANVQVTDGVRGGADTGGSVTGGSSKVVDAAKSQLGVPYLYGGVTPGVALDCSALSQYAYKMAGKTIPRTSQLQFANGTSIAKENLQPGDLVFFKSSGTVNAPGHVGVYVGNDQFIHAPSTGKNVQYATLSARSDYVGARRYEKGTPFHPGGLAMVGDENWIKGWNSPAPEMAIYPDGRAELVGENGVEIRDLPKGTQVIPAKKTKNILHSYANGTSENSFDPYAPQRMGVDSSVLSVGKGLNYRELRQIYDNILSSGKSEAEIVKLLKEFLADVKYLYDGKSPDKNVNNEIGKLLVEASFSANMKNIAASPDDQNTTEEITDNFAHSLDEWGSIFQGIDNFLNNNWYDELPGNYQSLADSNEAFYNAAIKEAFGDKKLTNAQMQELKGIIPGTASWDKLVDSINKGYNLANNAIAKEDRVRYTYWLKDDPFSDDDEFGNAAQLALDMGRPLHGYDSAGYYNAVLLQQSLLENMALKEILPQISYGSELEKEFELIAELLKENEIVDPSAYKYLRDVIKQLDPLIKATLAIHQLDYEYATSNGEMSKFEYENRLKALYGDQGLLLKSLPQTLEAFINGVSVPDVQLLSLDERDEYIAIPVLSDGAPFIISKSEFDAWYKALPKYALDTKDILAGRRYETNESDETKINKYITNHIDSLRTFYEENNKQAPEFKGVFFNEETNLWEPIPNYHGQIGTGNLWMAEDGTIYEKRLFNGQVYENQGLGELKNLSPEDFSEAIPEEYEKFLKETSPTISLSDGTYANTLIAGKLIDNGWMNLPESTSGGIGGSTDSGEVIDPDIKAVNDLYDRFMSEIGKVVLDSRTGTMSIDENDFLTDSEKANAYYDVAKKSSDRALEITDEHNTLVYESLMGYIERFKENPDLMNQEVLKAYDELITNIADQAYSFESSMAERRDGFITQMEKELEDVNDFISDREFFNDWNSYNTDKVAKIKEQIGIINDYKDYFSNEEEYNKFLGEYMKTLSEAMLESTDSRLEDIQEYIDERDYWNDWDKHDDSKAEAIKRQIQILVEAYDEGSISVDAFNERMAEYRKSLHEAGKQEAIDSLNLRSSKIDSLKSIIQENHNILNEVTDARHEIQKELKASMSMYEWLDKDTRELLFNKKDFDTLNKELTKIEQRANSLRSNYERDIQNASETMLPKITSQYQMQYETLMKSYEIAKADLEVAKKKQKLNNVLNERNVRMFINGRWQWVANTQDVINAQSEYDDAVYNASKAQTSLVQTQEIQALTTAADSIAITLKNVEENLVDFSDALIRIGSQWINVASGKSDDELVFHNGRYVLASSLSEAVANEYGIMPPTSNEVGYEYGATVIVDGVAYTGSEIERLLQNSPGHASGTKHTSSGWAKLGEKEDELFINANGHLIPINQPTIGNLSAGGLVFNQEQLANATKLWDMCNVASPNYGNIINKSLPQSIDNSNCHNVIINGITVSGQDGQNIIEALKRYVPIH